LRKEDDDLKKGVCGLQLDEGEVEEPSGMVLTGMFRIAI
jgi:hypothetical protein